MSSASWQPEKLLSPFQLARALGVGESTVKRWIDQGRIPARRTAGGHRRISFEQAIAFIRGHRLTVSDPGALDLSADQPTPDALAALLRSPSPETAVPWIERLYASGMDAAELADGWLAPAMSAVGHCWEAGELAVTDEHAATLQVSRALHAVLRLHLPAPDQPLAFVAALAGDPYVVPSLCAELVLREAGFRVRSFGPNTPADDLAQAIGRASPRLLALSFSLAEGTQATLRQRAALRDAARAAGAAVVVGGRGASEALVDSLGAAAWCRTMRELARLAHHVAGTPLAKPGGRRRRAP
ncbi:MAG TPA: helix-turn-helix domain-containing protein [Myxococcota bacterium]|nr:helix-turn-helix domain-containing protein [Myxococcota bacterium]